MLKKLLYIWLVLGMAVTAAAQLPHSYYCDFENEAENAQWVLNKSGNASLVWENKWTIGGAEAALGEQAMYISYDGGTTAGYKKTTSNIMIAYRELTLEAGRYDVAFDWMCGGDSTRAALLVAWVPEKDFLNSKGNDQIICRSNDEYKLIPWINQNLLSFNGDCILTGGSVWTHAEDTLVSDGTPHRLVYLFVYSSAAQQVHPGPCVDNIQLSRNNCGKPTQMKVKTQSTTAMLSWESQAESFNIRVHRMSDNQAAEVRGITAKSFTTTLKEGVYDIQIQTICEGDTSVWYSFPTAFIYETKCFDYLDLTDDRCFFSPETASDYTKNDPLLKPGRIDYGFTSMWSRHTIHYHPEEYDARTYGSIDSNDNPVSPLKTVPEGSLASVRIGSWEKTARVARVEYDFVVDANEAAVLMLKYAMVLESSGHNEAARPRLTIDIVDAKNGKALSKCTTVDLAAQTSGDGWYRVPDPEQPDGSRDICWRDWTTLGLNLADFDGKHVKVKITVMGCTAEIHYGYAYFTLTCTSGKLEGIQCGWTPTNEFIAPEGFNYRWYKTSSPSETLGREQVYKVDYTDTCTYGVDITYKSNKECGFTLYANAIPRFPIPEATYKLEQRDCGNYITFTNKSHIRTRNWKTGEEIDTPYAPEYVLWDFDGFVPEGLDTPAKRWSPSFRLPDEEADYHYRLYAGVGLCDSVQEFHIHVPRVGVDSVFGTKQLCEGDIYQHQGKYFSADTVLVEKDVNIAGCDSFYIMTLRFVDAIRDTVDAIIQEGDTFTVGPQHFTQTGDYTVTMRSLSGCDSIVTLHLIVNERLEMEILSIESPCPEDPSFLIETHARKGKPDSYKLSFSEAAEEQGLAPQSDKLSGGPDYTITVPLPKALKPGYYPFTLRFDSKVNGSKELTGEMVLRYSASLIQQRWDDVLGILNADYNGGLTFASYQWYKNGILIEGATEPFLYEENKLQPNDEYTVELVLQGEERPLATCAYKILPAPAPQAPKRQKVIQNNNIYIIIDGRTYNAQGVLVNFIY